MACTTIGPTAPGSTCRSMIRALPPPAARAASTNSFSFKLRNVARTSRASPIQERTPMTSAIGRMLPCRKRNSVGTDQGAQHDQHEELREAEEGVSQAHQPASSTPPK